MIRSISIIYFFFFTFTINAQNYFVYRSDTINKIDSAGKKQGKWILLGFHKPLTCYASEQKVEEGIYLNNKKTGVWLEYFCNGNLKNKITFADGRPKGYAIIYYENGICKEEGVWNKNRWVGDYKQYYKNGNLSMVSSFDSIGKHKTNSVFFSETGKIIIMQKNVPAIDSTDWDRNLIYDNFKMPTFPRPARKIDNDTTKKDLVRKENIYLSEPIVLNGKHTLYNNHKQVTKDGFFKDNRFMDGKCYLYNEEGTLTRIAIYKNGVYVGDTDILSQGLVIQNYREGNLEIEGKFKIKGASPILEFKSIYNKKNQLIKEGSFKKRKLYSGKEYFL